MIGAALRVAQRCGTAGGACRERAGTERSRKAAAASYGGAAEDQLVSGADAEPEAFSRHAPILLHLKARREGAPAHAFKHTQALCMRGALSPGM